MFEKSLKLLLVGRPRSGGWRMRPCIRGPLWRFLPETVRASLEPFIPDQKHRLCDIKRGEGWIDGSHNDHIGQRHLLVAQAESLPSEENPDPLPLRNALPHILHAPLGG